MKEFDIRDENGFPKICDRCIHKEVCYYLNEYGECTHCNYFIEPDGKTNKGNISIILLEMLVMTCLGIFESEQDKEFLSQMLKTAKEECRNG